MISGSGQLAELNPNSRSEPELGDADADGALFDVQSGDEDEARIFDVEPDDFDDSDEDGSSEDADDELPEELDDDDNETDDDEVFDESLTSAGP